MKEKLKRSFEDTKILFKEIPIYIIVIFILTVIGMNILANITLYQSQYLAIDAGFTVSWIVFIIMDLITIHFGVKATIKLSVFAIVINLITSLVFYLISLVPGIKENGSFESVFGTWFTSISSAIAFLVSAIINAFLNHFIGKIFVKNPNGKMAFISRTYVSTLIGQFIDNLIFATLTFMVFAPIFWNGFHWTITQCLTCSILFACIELVMEIIFSPIGYRISKKWKDKGVGKNYLHSK